MSEAQVQLTTSQTSVGSATFVKAADYRVIYANQIQVSLTPFDIHLYFSHGTAPAGIATNELQATVFLAPGEAKLLASILTRVVGDYERQFGTIPIPPQLLTPPQETPTSGT